jgi:two-component system, NarL family, nitrate/nitrite response regulator NarL
METESNQEQRVRSADTNGRPSTVAILSEIRFLREGLAEAIERGSPFSISGLFAELDDVVALVRYAKPDIVLIDVAFPDGTAAVRQIRGTHPEVQVVVFAVSETEQNIVTWAEAGVAGYIPATAALCDLVELVTGIMRGEQLCSRRVASGLVRRVAHIGNTVERLQGTEITQTLTYREQQITSLICAGLSNKEIARQLKIEVSTTKSHVHNVLEKLKLHRRGQIAWRWRGNDNRAVWRFFNLEINLNSPMRWMLSVKRNRHNASLPEEASDGCNPNSNDRDVADVPRYREAIYR